MKYYTGPVAELPANVDSAGIAKSPQIDACMILATGGRVRARERAATLTSGKNSPASSRWRGLLPLLG